MSSYQLSLFDVQAAYSQASGSLSNEALYSYLSRQKGIPRESFEKTTTVGKSKERHSLLKRKVRWYQQTLKHLGVITNVGKGAWEIAERENSGLHSAPAGMSLVSFSTTLGAALWADCKILKRFSETIHLCLTSPPYPLRRQRQYGNVSEDIWVDFLCRSLNPVVSRLAPGGSIVLNVGNDIFLSMSPARSLYLEKMVIALNDRLGLFLMDRIPWVNSSKPPAPTYWCCVQKKQLCAGWEPIYWFCNDPSRVQANNSNVLEEHTISHRKLLAAGGESRTVSYGGGAYTLRPGSFGKETKGKIPKNTFIRGHSCADTREVRRSAKSLGVPTHPAVFPTALPDFFIRFLTNAGDLVVDIFSGTFKTSLAAERLGRRWLGTEKILEYHLQAMSLFGDCPGYFSSL